MEENKEIFTYTYSARQQEEVRRILQKYTSPQEDKMELLRRLDKSAQQPGTIAGIALGVCGTLMLGLGMCCTMCGQVFSPWAWPSAAPASPCWRWLIRCFCI